MTDDELKTAFESLKPKTHWGQLITVGLAIGGSVWGVTQYLGDLAKRGEVNVIRDDIIRIKLEVSTIGGRQERDSQTTGRMEKAIERIEAGQGEAKRKRRRGASEE